MFGSNYIGGKIGTSITANNINQLTSALLNMNANKKGCINTDKIIDTGSVQLTGIQSITGNATLLNTTSILYISNDSAEEITITADTGGEVLGRILLIKNRNETYDAVLGGARCVARAGLICYYTGSAWTNLLSLAYT